MKKLTPLSYAFILAGLGVLLAIALSYQESQIWIDDDTQHQILYAARHSPPEGITTAVIAKETGFDHRAVMVECEYLADRNFMEIIEWGLHGHLIRITDEGKQVLKSHYQRLSGRVQT
ncbi:MAG TPA: hypothetical protein VE862_02505 [Candidatus Acidoferrum sp.]|nr:hypothetical protein [Candidatus Acidoferrum sp.]